MDRAARRCQASSRLSDTRRSVRAVMRFGTGSRVTAAGLNVRLHSRGDWRSTSGTPCRNWLPRSWQRGVGQSAWRTRCRPALQNTLPLSERAIDCGTPTWSSPIRASPTRSRQPRRGCSSRMQRATSPARDGRPVRARPALTAQQDKEEPRIHDCSWESSGPGVCLEGCAESAAIRMPARSLILAPVYQRVGALQELTTPTVPRPTRPTRPGAGPGPSPRSAP
jgi:hypothetical protein